MGDIILAGENDRDIDRDAHTLIKGRNFYLFRFRHSPDRDSGQERSGGMNPGRRTSSLSSWPYVNGHDSFDGSA